MKWKPIGSAGNLVLYRFLLPENSQLLITWPLTTI